MPGIFITSGMDLRIPAGGLVIPLDGSTPPPVRVEVRLDAWQHWLVVASDNVAIASTRRAELIEATAAGDDARKAEALEAEFRPAMTAMTACALAVDAFYATVSARFGRHPDATVWSKKRTARYAQIAETFRYHFKIKPAGAKIMRQLLNELFRFRDLAVHPSSAFREPSYRHDLDAGVEPRFVTFSAEHAARGLGLTIELLTVLIDKAGGLATGDNAAWTAFARARIDEVRHGARVQDGVEFPNRDDGS